MVRTHCKETDKRTHILTSNSQYIYKEGISTTDAIIKVEQYIEQADSKAKILLMGLPKAFGAINRTLLWATLYTKGFPGEMTKRKKRTYRNQTSAEMQWGIWHAK